MKKLWTLGIALAASLALTAPAHAFLIDGFGDTQPTDGTRLVSSGDLESDTLVGISDTDLTNVTRTLKVEQTGTTTGEPGNPTVEAAVDGDASGGAGGYIHDQDPGTLGYSRIEWEFAEQEFSDPVNILVNVAFIDNPAKIYFGLGDAEGGAYSDFRTLNAGETGSQIFSFSGFDGLNLARINSAFLEIDGRESAGLDVTLEFVEVPAPGMLGLFGIGIVGLALVARRRRNSIA